MTETGERARRIRPANVVTTFLLAALLAGSVTAAWLVPVPAELPTLAWNSPWVFRAEVFVGVFIGAYVLLAVCAATIRTGRPPRKLSFGMVSYEESEVEKAADALNEGRAALRAVQTEVAELRDRVAQAVAGARSANETLLALASAVDASSRETYELGLREQIAALRKVESAPDKAAEGDFARAMSRLEGTLAELDEMMGRRPPAGSS